VGGAIAGEEGFDGRAFGQVDGIFGAADDFLEAAEKEHLDSNCGGNGCHKGIVTLAVVCE